LVEPNKSILLVDFDSVHRSLTGAGGEAAARLVTRIPGWVKGLSSGRLIGPDDRTLLVKRCYADPKAIGEGRLSFKAAGFEVIDCPATNGGRGVDLLMAMDALDQLAANEDINEFILLSAEATLAPLLTRLKQKGHRVAIYADSQTGQAYRMLADSVLDIGAFAEFLLMHDAPEGAATQTIDRSEIEAFARRIHTATNIPLFSPRTFAELFRILTEEIIARGYHFQTTAKNVADRLSESGRSVTRRQVVFIVKGLALKGHVFSTTDSPRKLAEVFREQAHYLIESAGLKLDEAQERILSAWLVDRVPTSVGRPPAPPPSASRPPPALNGAGRAVADTRGATTAAPTRPASPQTPPGETRVATTKTVPDHTVPAGVTDNAMAAREPARETGADKHTTPPPSLPARTETRAPGTMISPDDARAAIAAKIAQSVRPKPTTARPLGKTAASATPSTSAPPASDEAAGDQGPESIENSILAAIAEAVDVLVEDGVDSANAKRPATAPAAARKRVATPAPGSGGPRPQSEARPLASPATKTGAEPRPSEEGDDIGDEIQRIIATYSRNRKEEPPA
jgi:hypothetical protein